MRRNLTKLIIPNLCLVELVAMVTKGNRFLTFLRFSYEIKSDKNPIRISLSDHKAAHVYFRPDLFFLWSSNDPEFSTTAKYS